MSKSKKPHKRYRPRVVTLDTISLAMRRARLIPKAEIDEAMAPIDSSFRAMREGVATEDQWCVLAGSVELALSIEHTRVGTITGVRGHLHAAETALAEIARRARTTGAWRPVPMHLQEIEHLDTFLLLHQAQLEQMSEGEWRQAHEHARAHVLSAGGRAVDITELQMDQGQMELIGAPA